MVRLDWRAVAAAGVVVLVIAYVIRDQAKVAAQAVGEAVNPLSRGNIFYTGAESTVMAVTGDKYLVDILTPVFNFFTGKKVT